MSDDVNSRLSDLLANLRESPEVEVKGWLDLENNNEHKAILAKAALALANHGGGRLVLGFEEVDGIMVEAENRPATLNPYNQDLINGIVRRYCEPEFHCTVHLVPHGGKIFPVVEVPGGHDVPVRARRAGPDEKILQMNAIYIRKPGPRSEPPQSGQEWDRLLARCLSNRSDELLGHIQRIVSGAASQERLASDNERLDEWITTCFDRWSSLIDQLPPEAIGPRFSYGCYNFAYEIVGDARETTLAQLPHVLQRSVVHLTGWPPFWFPTRKGIAPYPADGAVECWIGGDTDAEPGAHAPDHSDFWRISPDGYAFLLRGYREDRGDLQFAGQGTAEPGTVFSVTKPVWRVGETLLQAQRLAENLFEGPTTIRFSAKYTGLKGRSLVSINGGRHIMRGQICHQESVSPKPLTVESGTISSMLPQMVHRILSPLYELFGFFRLPMDLVVEELDRMRNKSLY